MEHGRTCGWMSATSAARPSGGGRSGHRGQHSAVTQHRRCIGAGRAPRRSLWLWAGIRRLIRSTKGAAKWRMGIRLPQRQNRAGRPVGKWPARDCLSIFAGCFEQVWGAHAALRPVGPDPPRPPGRPAATPVALPGDRGAWSRPLRACSAAADSRDADAGLRSTHASGRLRMYENLGGCGRCASRARRLEDPGIPAPDSAALSFVDVDGCVGQQ